MSDTKISSLTAATAALGTNELPINEGGASKKLTVAQIVAFIKAVGVWTDVATGVGFVNSWGNYYGGYGAACYMKDALGFVHLRGAVKSGSAATIFTLPAGYRPVAYVSFAVTAGPYTPGVVDIGTNGDVMSQVGTNAIVSLEGITFYAA